MLVCTIRENALSYIASFDGEFNLLADAGVNKLTCAVFNTNSNSASSDVISGKAEILRVLVETQPGAIGLTKAEGLNASNKLYPIKLKKGQEVLIYLSSDNLLLRDVSMKIWQETDAANDEDVVIESKVIDLESSFIQEFDFEDNSYKYNLLKSINTLLEKDSISIDVLNNLYSLIDELPEEVINLIDMDNIYVSEIGTVIIDIYNEEGLFSLEVGRTKVGYFAEIDNSFVCQNDGVEFNSDNSENSPVIIKDLLEFNDLVVPV